MIVNIQYPSGKEHKLYAVAYLDLLGTTEKIKNDDKGDYFFRIYTIYNMAVSYGNNQALASSPYRKIKTKIFSDNIIMAMPLDSSGDTNNLSLLISFVSVFQNYANVLYSWLVRGGLTVGELFIDDIFVWGTGLLRAYELESQVAFYPRVVVDENVVALFPNNFVGFCRDIDGKYFTNFLSYMEYHAADGNDNLVPTIQNSFRTLLSDIKDPIGRYHERALQKLQWYRVYINSWFQKKYPSANIVPIDDSFFAQFA